MHAFDCFDTTNSTSLPVGLLLQATCFALHCLEALAAGELRRCRSSQCVKVSFSIVFGATTRAPNGLSTAVLGVPDAGTMHALGCLNTTNTISLHVGSHLKAMGFLLHRLDTLGADGLRRRRSPQRVEVRFGVTLTAAPWSLYRLSIVALGVPYAGTVFALGG